MPMYIDLNNPKIIHMGRDKFGNGIYHIPPDLPTADVVDKERYDRLLGNSTIIAEALRKYQSADMVEVVYCNLCQVRTGATGGDDLETTFVQREKGEKMPRPIDEDEAIKVVHKVIYDYFDMVEDDDESPITYKDKQLLEINKKITQRIKELPSAQPSSSACWGCNCPKMSAQQWIPVTERLPEDDRAVLVYEATYNNIFTACCEDGRWESFGIESIPRWYDESPYGNITAWMPLPEPYRERSEND